MCLRTETRQLLGRRAEDLKPTAQYPRFRGSKIELALTLLEAGVFFVDNVELAITAHNLAIDTTLFDGGFDFHDEQKINFFNTSKSEVISYLCLSALPANNRRTTTRTTKLKTIPAETATN